MKTLSVRPLRYRREPKDCLTCAKTFQPAKSTRIYCSNVCSAARRIKEDASYEALHIWLNRKNSKTGKCTFCETTKSKRTEWALKKGRTYSRNVEDYLELCTSCHKKYDYTEEQGAKRSKARTGRKRVTNGHKITYV